MATPTLEINSSKVICSKCGTAFPKRKGNFYVNYGGLYKGVGTLSICKKCIEDLYKDYYSQCKDARSAVRQMCRKLDLYWNDELFDTLFKVSPTRTIMSHYISKVATLKYAGKSYDDTLAEEGTMWDFGDTVTEEELESEKQNNETKKVPKKIIKFWGSGYPLEMYIPLQERYEYWLSKFPEGYEIDIGTEAIIRQICSLELDINRDRAEGKSVDKSINALNTLLGSANLKPNQQKDDSASLDTVPFGVGIGWCEHYEPIERVKEELRDAGDIRKNTLVWVYGHLAKMLGEKRIASKLYEETINAMRLDYPQFADEDDEELIYDVVMSESDVGDK